MTLTRKYSYLVSRCANTETLPFVRCKLWPSSRNKVLPITL